MNQHFALKKVYNPQQLFFRFDPEDQSALNSKLKKRISALKKLKVKIKYSTKSIIKTILNLHSSAIKELNILVNNYQKIFNTQEFYDINEPEKILKTEMRVKDFSCENLISKINELFPKEFFSFDVEPDRKSDLIKNKFLETHCDGFSCLDISTDGNIFVAGSYDATVRVLDFVERKIIACCSGHSLIVICVIISSYSTFAVSKSQDKSLIVWDLKRYSLRQVLRIHRDIIDTIALSSDDNLLISCQNGKEIGYGT